MKKWIKHVCRLKSEKGAIAIIVGISMVMFIGFTALAVDIGHLMVIRNELQNVAVGNTPGTFTNGMMGVDFATGKVGLQFDLAFPGFNYQVATTGGAASPANSQVAITAGSKFGGTVPITPSGAVPAACVSACAANINGAFFGQTGPDAAGFVYDGGGVRGAAVFKK